MTCWKNFSNLPVIQVILLYAWSKLKIMTLIKRKSVVLRLLGQMIPDDDDDDECIFV